MKRLFGLLVCICLVTALVPAHAIADADPADPVMSAEKATGEKYAIVVGVANYLSISDLPADPINNDVAITRDVLVNYCGFKSQNVMVYKDYQARKSAIRNAISTLGSRMGPNDMLFFYFSGHGANGPDAYPYDEPDYAEEYLCPYDSATDSYLYDISDDELKSWLDAINSKYTICVLDTCFSGGMVKAGNMTGASPYEQGKAVTKSVPAGNGLNMDDMKSDFAKDLSRSNYLVLMACDVNQESGFCRNHINSAFTYYFVEGLRTGTADTDHDLWLSAEEAFWYAKPLARQYSYQIQDAQMYDGNPGSEVELSSFLGPSPSQTPTTTPTTRITTIPTTRITTIPTTWVRPTFTTRIPTTRPTFTWPTRTTTPTAQPTVPPGACDIDQVSGTLDGAGDKEYWTIDVPAGTEAWTLRLTGPSGSDFDIYIRKDFNPSEYFYTWRGYSTTSNEEILIPRPPAGTYKIMVKSYRGSGTYTLRSEACTATGGPTQTPTATPTRTSPWPWWTTVPTTQPTTGGPGLCFSDRVSGTLESGQKWYWEVNIPGNVETWTVTLTGPSTADFDVYIRKDFRPTTSFYQYAGRTTSSNEVITITRPPGGTYNIMVYAYQGTGVYTLESKYCTR